jgi:hypothetical protein
VKETIKGSAHFLQLLQNAEQRIRAGGSKSSLGTLIAGLDEMVEIDFGIPVIRLGFLGDAQLLQICRKSSRKVSESGSSNGCATTIPFRNGDVLF